MLYITISHDAGRSFGGGRVEGFESGLLLSLSDLIELASFNFGERGWGF